MGNDLPRGEKRVKKDEIRLSTFMSERAGPTAEPVPPQPDDDDGFEKVNAKDVPPAAAGDQEECAKEGEGGGQSLFSLRKPRDVGSSCPSLPSPSIFWRHSPISIAAPPPHLPVSQKLTRSNRSSHI